MVPQTGSSCVHSLSVNPTSAWTRREAMFHSQTIAHKRLCPANRARPVTAPNRARPVTALAASVA